MQISWHISSLYTRILINLAAILMIIFEEWLFY